MLKSPSALACTALLALSTARAVPPQKHITITEGTNVQVTVSPDGKILLADFQGLLYTLPATGGTAKQVTTPMQEASNADWSKQGNFIAMQCYAGGTFHLWTMRPDGTGLKQLTTGHGDDREPRVSPDGRTIAFTSDRAFAGSYDIWTVDVATGTLRQITHADADEFGPNWSPDGKSLAFISGTGNAGKSIEVIDLGTLQQHTAIQQDVTKGRLEAPSFSPDGSQLAYIRFTGAGMLLDGAHLEVAPLAGGTPSYIGKAVDTFPFAPTWLSATELVYSGDGKILRTSLTAGTEAAIPFTAAIPANRPLYTHTKPSPSTPPAAVRSSAFTPRHLAGRYGRSPSLR